MGVGKSTVAQQLDPNFIDTDAVIAGEFEMSTAAYFEEFGEAAFRKREEEVLALLLSAVSPDRIGLSLTGHLIEVAANSRKTEASCPSDALADKTLSILQSRVIATGGGIIESEKNQALLRQQKQVVYLSADLELLRARITADSIEKNLHRSVFENSTEAEFQAIYERRAAIYESLADLTIDTTDKSPEIIASQILASFK